MTIVTIDYLIKDMTSPACAFEASDVFFNHHDNGEGYISITWAIHESDKFESKRKWKEVLKFREILKHYNYTEAEYNKLGNQTSHSSERT